MEYQLITPLLPDNMSLVERVFFNRGITQDKITHYLNTTDEDILDDNLIDNIQQGVKMLIKHIHNSDPIFVQVDSDADGFTSAAILINFLHQHFPHYVDNYLSYRLHDGKQHGLIPETVPEGIKMVICPDSSSNDYEAHAEMAARGIDVLVIDHHIAKFISKDACIINNQIDDYPTKSLSGAGMVYKFCHYIDTLLGTQGTADKYLDLAAIGMIADMVDLRDYETRRLITKGLSDITNPYLVREVAAQNFSISKKGGLMPFTVSFYIAPMINATIRVGSLEQKYVLFESMLETKAYEAIPSTKRGCKGQMEPRVEQAVRNCNNLKTRQNNTRDAGLEIIENIIKRNNLLNDPVLIIQLQPEFNISKSMTGLIANILANDYQRPCIILNRNYNEETGEVMWEGSARGYEMSALKNFRNWLLNHTCVNFAEGHANAFGVGISDDKFAQFCNEVYNDLEGFDFTPVYRVDAIYTADNFNSSEIAEIGGLKQFWGQNLTEPYIAIEHIKLNSENTQLLSRDKSPTLKITLPNGTSLIKFGSSEEEYEELTSNATYGYTEITVVGTCAQNVWGSRVEPQIEIADYAVTFKGWEF